MARMGRVSGAADDRDAKANRKRLATAATIVLDARAVIANGRRDLLEDALAVLREGVQNARSLDSLRWLATNWRLRVSLRELADAERSPWMKRAASEISRALEITFPAGWFVRNRLADELHTASTTVRSGESQGRGIWIVMALFWFASALVLLFSPLEGAGKGALLPMASLALGVAILGSSRSALPQRNQYRLWKGIGIGVIALTCAGMVAALLQGIVHPGPDVGGIVSYFFAEASGSAIAVVVSWCVFAMATEALGPILGDLLEALSRWCRPSRADVLLRHGEVWSPPELIAALRGSTARVDRVVRRRLRGLLRFHHLAQELRGDANSGPFSPAEASDRSPYRDDDDMRLGDRDKARTAREPTPTDALVMALQEGELSMGALRRDYLASLAERTTTSDDDAAARLLDEGAVLLLSAGHALSLEESRAIAWKASLRRGGFRRLQQLAKETILTEERETPTRTGVRVVADEKPPTTSEADAADTDGDALLEARRHRM